jgi:hypothetical protein
MNFKPFIRPVWMDEGQQPLLDAVNAECCRLCMPPEVTREIAMQAHAGQLADNGINGDPPGLTTEAGIRYAKQHARERQRDFEFRMRMYYRQIRQAVNRKALSKKRKAEQDELRMAP